MTDTTAPATPDSDAATDDPRNELLLEIEQELSVLLHTTRARVKVLVEMFDPELQPAAFSVLRYVTKYGPVRAGGIAAALSMDKSSISRQITVLRDRGLLETRQDPEDGRATILVTTPAANEALGTFRSHIRADYSRTLAGWDAGDISEFARLLHRFNTSLP